MLVNRHSKPPFADEGLLHSRVLVFRPLPHVKEHRVYELHCPQLPLTEQREMLNYILFVIFLYKF